MGCIYGPLRCALSLRGTREDCEDLARGSLRAPHHGLVGGHHKAVAGLKCFIRSCDAGVQSSFDHVGGELANAAAFANGRGDSGWDFKDLRELVSFCGGDVQGRGPRAMFAATGGDVRSARDGDGVMLRLAEEVAEADSVDGAKSSPAFGAWEPCGRFRAWRAGPSTGGFVPRGEKA